MSTIRRTITKSAWRSAVMRSRAPLAVASLKPRNGNGGDAALKVADWLKTEKILVDLAITCNPVPYVRICNVLDSVWKARGNMPTEKPKNVSKWFNFYQSFDKGSLFMPPALNVPIRGRRVKGADWEKEVVLLDFAGDKAIPWGKEPPEKAHIFMPELTMVRTLITTEIKMSLHSPAKP